MRVREPRSLPKNDVRPEVTVTPRFGSRPPGPSSFNRLLGLYSWRAVTNGLGGTLLHDNRHGKPDWLGGGRRMAAVFPLVAFITVRGGRVAAGVCHANGSAE